MNIEEIQTLKKKLELDILNLVIGFDQQSPVPVEGIRLTAREYYNDGGDASRFNRVEVDLDRI